MVHNGNVYTFQVSDVFGISFLYKSYNIYGVFNCAKQYFNIRKYMRRKFIAMSLCWFSSSALFNICYNHTCQLMIRSTIMISQISIPKCNVHICAMFVTSCFYVNAGLFLGLRPASERRRYKVSHWLGANLESALKRKNLGYQSNLFFSVDGNFPLIKYSEINVNVDLYSVRWNPCLMGVDKCQVY